MLCDDTIRHIACMRNDFCFNGFNQTAIVLRYSANIKPHKTIKPDWDFKACRTITQLADIPPRTLDELILIFRASIILVQMLMPLCLV